MTVRDIEKYRRRNAASEVPGLGDHPVCAVIPCYNENSTFGAALASLEEAAACVEQKVAVLAVINYPEGADPEESLELERRIRANEFSSSRLYSLYAPGLTGGVGEARKIGMDSYLQSLPAEKAASALICSMDADTLVEKDYFKEVCAFFQQDHRGAVSIGLSHLPGENEAQELAIRRYEAYFERYAAQLKRCGSPYGFHTVGSAFAVTGEAYMKCGGMKVRRAGEDFYFLQAVAKTSGVGVIEKKLVHPSPRISARTPFGTGQSVRDIISGKALNEVSDGAFDRLKRLLDEIRFDRIDTDEPLLPEKEFLEAEGFFKVWPGIRRNTPPEKLCGAFHVWFDGLKTLRFLHICDA